MGCNSSIQVGLENINQKPISVSLVGLPNAGKTSIIEYLAGEYNINDPPIHTNGILLRDLSIHNILYRIFDIGGNGASVNDIKDSINNSQAVIFVFDQLTFEYNVSANKEMVKNCSPCIKDKKLPVVVIINKVNESNPQSADDQIEKFVESFFGSETLVHFSKMGRINDEVFSVFQWIYNNVQQ